MSNCVNIYDPDLVIPGSHIDLDKLETALSRHKNAGCEGHFRCKLKDKAPAFEFTKDIEPLICESAYWFLVEGRNVTFNWVNHSVRILLGQGKSTHTWRDLKQTLSVLSYFMIKPVIVTMKISDEFDGHKAKGDVKFTMIPRQMVKDVR